MSIGFLRRQVILVGVGSPTRLDHRRVPLDDIRTPLAANWTRPQSRPFEYAPPYLPSAALQNNLKHVAPYHDANVLTLISTIHTEWLVPNLSDNTHQPCYSESECLAPLALA